MSKSSDSGQKKPISLIALVFLGGIVVGIVAFYLISNNHWSAKDQTAETVPPINTSGENFRTKESTQTKKQTEFSNNVSGSREDSILSSGKNPAEHIMPTDSSIIDNADKGTADNAETMATAFDKDEYVATDEMIGKRSINIRLPKRDVSLDSLLINDKTPPMEDLIYVEFWRSPINYTGYKYRKNKLILFGFYEPDSVQLKLHNSKLALFYNSNVFLLEETEDFKALQLKRKK